MPCISREDFINNNRTSTKKKIRDCNGVRKELLELMKQEKNLARIYEKDGARDTAKIIRYVNIPLIHEALKETVHSSKVDEQ